MTGQTLQERIAEQRIARLKQQLMFWRSQAAKLEDVNLRAFAEKEVVAVQAKIEEAQDDLGV